ncbi:glycosyltransferase family 4 protein [Monashia sp. NPDC004114]
MRIAFLNWRDLTHSEGGGAERYAQTVCAGLAERGHDVVFFCAAHPHAPRSELRDGYRIVRAGGRMGVYPRALQAMRREARRGGPFDAVVDTQNGLPFWSPLATRSPVVSLVHHVHREQWPVVFGPVMARAGWFVESRVSPVVYRGRPCVTVSDRSRDELCALGLDRESITVIHNGTDSPMALSQPRAVRPTIVVLGRLVPHKRVELAIDVLARLQRGHPDLELRIIGDGWWHERIVDHADRAGVSSRVRMLGYVDELTKHRELARAWLALAPSAKEGWGLNVVEAASHGIPTIAHHGAGGLSESIVDGQTGLLVEDVEHMASVTSDLLLDHARREELGRAARVHARRYSWLATVDAWEQLLGDVSGLGAESLAESRHESRDESRSISAEASSA